MLLTSFFACEPPVTFSEPQPTNTNNLSRFPNRLQGLYISLADSSTLSIDERLIQRIYDYDYRIHPNQIDSTLRIVGDTLVDLENNEKIFIKRDGDSLLAHIHYTDTLFLLTQDNVVRKFKGNFFLNTRYEKQGWEVKKVHLTKGQLIISSVSTKADIETLKELTKTTQDTIPPYKFTTTRRQFKRFVKNNGFSDKETFIKLRKNSL
ncbi:MAG TPA: hypothetical protein VKX40_04135 [Aequorivita sp.]|nr:hypothetical protein [Aequorivita sp.]